MAYKIMIVDDEPANLRALERLFRPHYEVVTTNSGAEALELLSHHDVALLISDQRMPGMTGIELLKKTVSLRPRMVRIILTGYTDVEALVEAINCGEVYRYITKPWSNEDLRVTVKRALEHFETNRKRHELQLTNERLMSLLQEIKQLATLEGSSELEEDLISERNALTR
jgi:DNA-binding NtrC family response regulator